MKFKGDKVVNTPLTISLARYTGGDEGSGWRLEVTDTDSCTTILSARINHEQFSAMMGHAYIEVEAELLVSANFGKKQENKAWFVPWKDKDYSNFQKFYAKAAKEALDQGWELDQETDYNHHRVDHKNNTYKFMARRWLEK